jgi:hypothetical protein
MPPVFGPVAVVGALEVLRGAEARTVSPSLRKKSDTSGR